MELTKEKLEVFIKDFETNPITVKWIESVDNRGKFQRGMDMDFFNLAKDTINRLIKLVILMNTLYDSKTKITDAIKTQQEKYLDIIDSLETTLVKYKNANKS
tara:strand:+ start:178 stop:483 length:306 start_codon:yes stop_codon:yes gene_type:complete